MSKKTDTKGTLLTIKVKHKINAIATYLNILILARLKAPFRSRLTKICFKVIVRARKWNQSYYDEVVKGLYVGVRTKEAMQLKERIIDTKKGGTHVKLLMIETPKGEMEIILRKQDYPDLYDSSKKSQLKIAK